MWLRQPLARRYLHIGDAVEIHRRDPLQQHHSHFKWNLAISVSSSGGSFFNLKQICPSKLEKADSHLYCKDALEMNNKYKRIPRGPRNPSHMWNICTCGWHLHVRLHMQLPNLQNLEIATKLDTEMNRVGSKQLTPTSNKSCRSHWICYPPLDRTKVIYHWCCTKHTDLKTCFLCGFLEPIIICMWCCKSHMYSFFPTMCVSLRKTNTRDKHCNQNHKRCGLSTSQLTKLCCDM